METELELRLELTELELFLELEMLLDRATLDDVFPPPPLPPPPQAVRPQMIKGRLQILIRYRMAILRLRYCAKEDKRYHLAAIGSQSGCNMMIIVMIALTLAREAL